jgi:transcriptional regulator with XRE-family HTH domain
MNEPDESGPAGRERELVEKFREVRQSLGLSQEELSRRLIEAGLRSMNQMAVSRLEAGKRALRFHEAVIIAETLGQSLPRLMETDYQRDADFIRHTALEAQIESNLAQLADLVVDTLRKQTEMIKVASKLEWATDEVSYLMASSLIPIQAATREAVSRYFQGEFGKLPTEFVSNPESHVQNEILGRYEEASHDADHELLSEYLRRVNGIDPEET